MAIVMLAKRNIQPKHMDRKWIFGCFDISFDCCILLYFLFIHNFYQNIRKEKRKNIDSEM